MYLDKPKIRELMDKNYNGNYHAFARGLNVDVGRLHRFLNTSSIAGPKFLGKFKKYCSQKGLNFDYYIFLD